MGKSLGVARGQSIVREESIVDEGREDGVGVGDRWCRTCRADKTLKKKKSTGGTYQRDFKRGNDMLWFDFEDMPLAECRECTVRSDDWRRQLQFAGELTMTERLEMGLHEIHL